MGWQTRAVPGQLLSAAAVLLSSVLLYHRYRRKAISARLLSHGPDVCLPPHVRSFLPVLGSALEMGRNIRQFIARHSARFRQPLFTANIGGNKCLFIGDPDHVTMVFKYSKYLDDLALQKQFTHNVLGITDQAKDDSIFAKDNDSLKEANNQFQHYLLSPGELNKTVSAAQELFQELLPKLVTTGEEGGWSSHGLFHMVRECVFKASVTPLLSAHAATEEAVRQFRSFEKGIPLMFGGAPAFLTREARASRKELLEMIGDARFIEEGSDLMKARQTLNLGDDVYNRTALGILFGAVGNSIPGVFWCLAHILADRKAYEAVQAEVEGILGSRERAVFTIEELDQMVLLESAFVEALRLYHGSFTTREVVQDFVFNPKKPGQPKYLIEKGTRVMAFMATMHHDEEVFRDAETFLFDRFAPSKGDDGRLQPRKFSKDERTVVEPVRPFGGGAHLCPGRKFIAYETRAFVGVLLTKFDMRLAGGAFPLIDYSSQGVGVSHPSTDVTVEIRLREGRQS